VLTSHATQAGDAVALQQIGNTRRFQMTVTRRGAAERGPEGKRRWCAGCGEAKGVVSVKSRKIRLDKRPRGTVGATACAGAKHGARSVRALEVLGGSDTDSDGDEAPQAEEEAAEEAVGEAVGEAAEEVKAEPAPALEPVIKREPSDSRRRHQQHQQQQPTCVRSAKRRADWARGGAGGPRARVEAGDVAAAAGYI
jgi:hypothetical protein